MKSVFSWAMIAALSFSFACSKPDGSGTPPSPGNAPAPVTVAMKRRCLTLDLKSDTNLMAEYKKYHEKIWPEITAGLHEAGVTDMEIYLFGNRMFMIFEYPENVDIDANMAKMNARPKNKEWEELMWKFQQSVPGSKPGDKWVEMQRIFKLEPKGL